CSARFGASANYSYIDSRRSYLRARSDRRDRRQPKGGSRNHFRMGMGVFVMAQKRIASVFFARADGNSRLLRRYLFSGGNKAGKRRLRSRRFGQACDDGRIHNSRRFGRGSRSRCAEAAALSCQQPGLGGSREECTVTCQRNQGVAGEEIAKGKTKGVETSCQKYEGRRSSSFGKKERGWEHFRW